ncbi:MAG: radical SAM protein [Alphaproteobacteria bacterium]|nr:radical SAM protein [Alphaproteobacteria bacterium]
MSDSNSRDVTQGTGPVRRSIYLPDKLDAIQSFVEFCRGQGRPKYPLEVYVEVSSLCNLKCGMCLDFSPLNRNRGVRNNATSGQIRLDQHLPQLTDVLKHALYVHCSGNTGETTTHKDFPWIIDMLGRFEVAIDFLTNGMLLTRELVELLVGKGVYKVTVSFSGATASDYEAMYIGGNFEKVLAGLKRLQQAKNETKSRYPLVEINSIGFKHHIDKLDKFVELMAAHGVSTIYVKPMVEFPEIMGELYGHRSVIRPWVEGNVVARAQDLAKAYGLHLYMDVDTANNEADYEQQLAQHRLLYETRSQGPLQIIPIENLKELALARQRARGPEAKQSFKVKAETNRAEPDLHPLSSTAEVERIMSFMPLVDIAAMDDPHCMQPFKTLYLCQSGLVKACNFAGGSPTLGDCSTTDALDIWNGNGYKSIHEAILSGSYSKTMCADCLKHQLGMTHHWIDHMLPNYLDWHIRTYGAFTIADANHLMAQLGPLGTNSEIVANHAAKRPAKS